MSSDINLHLLEIHLGNKKGIFNFSSKFLVWLLSVLVDFLTIFSDSINQLINQLINQNFS